MHNKLAFNFIPSRSKEVRNLGLTRPTDILLYKEALQSPKHGDRWKIARGNTMNLDVIINQPTRLHNLAKIENTLRHFNMRLLFKFFIHQIIIFRQEHVSCTSDRLQS